MRLKSYLTEGRTKIINELQFINDVKKRCSQIVDTYKKTNWTNIYYRGISDEFNSAFGFVQPSKFKRESAWATRNTYTLIIDNLSSWKKYPKRSKSIIMTTDRSDAQGRAGNNIPYICFPINGSKIGICPEDDIWDSFPRLFSRFDISNLNHFNHIMGQFATYIGMGKYDMDKWSDIEKLFKTLIPDPDTKEGFRAASLIDNFDLENDIGEPLGKEIIPYFEPMSNGFVLRKTNQPIPKKNVEAWTDGDSYLLDFNYLKVMKELL